MLKQFKFVRYNQGKHLTFLYNSMINTDDQYLFLQKITYNSLREFDHWLQDRLDRFYHEFYILEANNSNIMGMVYSYDEHLNDGHCKFAIYLCPQWRHSGLGAIAGISFLEDLFRCYSFRRIYCDVYRYNKLSLNTLKSFGFEETGYIKEYRYYNDAYHDLVFLTIERNDFIKRSEKILCRYKIGKNNEK